MLTKLLVIQKIEENGEVNIFQVHSENFQWTFETDRKSETGDGATSWEKTWYLVKWLSGFVYFFEETLFTPA